MSSIVFLQVDSEDQASVQESFPEATIVEGIPDDIEQACKDADIVSTFIGIDMNADILSKLPNLKLLCTRSVGFNHIDLEYCSKNNITVCHVPDYGSHVIAEHVFALLLSTLRHISEADKKVESGDFDYHGLRGVSLRGKTLGIIGTGKIGRKTAQIAGGFGMRILAVDKCRTIELEDLLHVKYVELDELLAESDIITLHLPAIKETHHMIDSDAFSKMKEGVCLVNTARGELIDSDALLNALNSGKVAHALLDVLEHEHNFEENKDLIKHKNVVSTPHIAFYAEESMKNMYDDCFTSIKEFQRGEEPEHVIHPPTVVCDLDGIRSKK
jgi:D-lactate dehydrogenase